MVKLFVLIKKNFKLISRSKTQAMIILFGPLILTLLVGLAFNNASLYNINIGVYSPQYGELENSFLEKLDEVQFKVLKLNSEEMCVDDIREGIVNVCMVFPEGFEIGEESGAKNEITFYVDPSQMNLVYSVIDIISTRVSARKEEISSELTAVILNTLENIKSTIVTQNPNFVDVIETNEEMQTKTSTVISRLGKLDLNFDESKFGLPTLKKANEDLQGSILSENGTLKKSVNNSLNGLNDIMDYVESHGNDSSLMSDLRTLEDDLEDILEDLEDMDDDVVKVLSSAVYQIENELNATKAKFTEAKDAKTEMTLSLNQIGVSLKTSQTNVMTIKGALDDLKKEIDEITVKDAGSIVSPITTTIKPVVSQTYLNYMFPGLIVLVVMFVSLLFAETIMMMEKSSKAYFRNLVTPTRDTLFLLAAFLSTFILLCVQLVIILGVSALVFRVDLFANIFPSLLIIFMIVTIFTMVGILIGIIFSSAETATIATISFGAVSLFISNVILPLESMPSYIMQIARFNPFVIAESLLRKTILFQTNIGSLIKESYVNIPVPAILFLSMYILLFLVAVLVVQALTKKRVLFKYVKKLAPKKAEKVVDIAENGLDPVSKIEVLIKQAHEHINKKEFKQAKHIYVHLNELYTMLPKHKKQDYFKKIVEIHKKI